MSHLRFASEPALEPVAPGAPRLGVMPSIDNLRCFVAASKTLNFRRAARVVALTPTALSQRIKQLERELGAKLFARTTRAVTPTPAGLALLPFAERCLAAASDCRRAARGETGPASVDLTLGTRHELGMSWILPQLARMGQRMPWLNLNLYFGSGVDLLLRTRTMELDCAVTSTRFEDPKLAALPLHREDYVFVAAPALLRRQPFTRHVHAERHTLLDISSEQPLFRYWRDAVAGRGTVKFQRATWLGGIDAIRHRALEGAGVAVLPHYHVKQDLAERRLHKLFPSSSLVCDYFRLVFRADDPRRWAFDALAEAMLAAPLS